MKRFSWIFILSLCLTSFNSFGQQEAMFTHYVFNTLYLNPAYAGTRQALTVNALHRSQWVGFNGAPNTQTLTLHSPVFRKELGMGFSAIRDQIGPLNITSFTLDLAYQLKIGNKSKLSVGLKGGMNIAQSELSILEINDQTDESFQNNLQGKILPSIGFGFYYHAENYYLGISSPRILENKYKVGTSSNNQLFNERRHYYFIAGGVFDLTETIKWRPASFVRATYGSPLQVDLTSYFVFKEFLWLGAAYRSGDAISGLLGLSFTPQLMFGYAFDWSYGMQTRVYNGGSHEVMLQYDFIFKQEEKIRSPRYF